MGIAMAGNVFTFFVFYELLTLATFPLVVPRGTPKAMHGGTLAMIDDAPHSQLQAIFLLLLIAGVGVKAALTIVWGSFRALFQDDLKKRLAFSTVSQVSYIALGVGLFGPVGTVGGLVHRVHQGIMKITLFFCAGNYAETLGIHKVSEIDGAGRRMPTPPGARSAGRA